MCTNFPPTSPEPATRASPSNLASESAFFDQVPDLDWDSAYQAFIPRVLAAPTTWDYYRELQRFAALPERPDVVLVHRHSLAHGGNVPQLEQGVRGIEGVKTKHFLREEIMVQLQDRSLRIESIEKLTYIGSGDSRTRDRSRGSDELEAPFPDRCACQRMRSQLR